jgi:hypothetical protein
VKLYNTPIVAISRFVHSYSGTVLTWRKIR